MPPLPNPQISMAEYLHLMVRSSYGSHDDHPVCGTRNWMVGVGPRKWREMRDDHTITNADKMCPRCLVIATDEYLETASSMMDLPNFSHVENYVQGGQMESDQDKLRRKCLEAVKALLDEDPTVVEYRAEFTASDDPRLPAWEKGGAVTQVIIRKGDAS